MSQNQIPTQRLEESSVGGRSPFAIAEAKKALRIRIIELTRMMNQMEDKATYHFQCFLARKDEIRIEVENEYGRTKRDHLGSSKEHVLDERVGKDSVCGSHAANNKWYISQATMYATMCQVEISRYKEGLY